MMTQNIEFPGRILRESLPVTLAAGLILLLRMLYSDGGAIHPEAYSFLRVYTEGRPFWATLYNPAFNDWIMYQPRELSYFVDSLDARFIAWCIHSGVVHFYPLSNLLLGCGTVFLQQYGARSCFPHLDGRLITAVSLIYALFPVTSVTYYRSAKPLTAFFLTASCFLILTLYRRLYDGGRWRMSLFLLSISLFLLMMADRQGAFFTAVFAAFCGLVLACSSRSAYVRHPEVLARTALISWGIVLFGTGYNLFLSPYLVYRLNGYVPDFDYQYTESGAVFAFSGGLEFVFSNLGRFFCGSGGGAGMVVGIAVMLLLAAALASHVRWRNGGGGVLADQRLSALLVFLYAGAALTACANVMVVKCPPILVERDLLNGSYATPMTALMVVFLLQAMNLTRGKRLWRTLWMLLLSAALLCQLEQYCPWNGEVPRALKSTFDTAYGPEVRAMKHLLADPSAEFRRFPLMFRNELLLRQMRGLPAFEDESRVYYYLRLYRGKRI